VYQYSIIYNYNNVNIVSPVQEVYKRRLALSDQTDKREISTECHA